LIGSSLIFCTNWTAN